MRARFTCSCRNLEIVTFSAHRNVFLLTALNTLVYGCGCLPFVLWNGKTISSDKPTVLGNFRRAREGSYTLLPSLRGRLRDIRGQIALFHSVWLKAFRRLCILGAQKQFHLCCPLSTCWNSFNLRNFAKDFGFNSMWQNLKFIFHSFFFFKSLRILGHFLYFPLIQVFKNFNLSKLLA